MTNGAAAPPITAEGERQALHSSTDAAKDVGAPRMDSPGQVCVKYDLGRPG